MPTKPEFVKYNFDAYSSHHWSAGGLGPAAKTFYCRKAQSAMQPKPF